MKKRILSFSIALLGTVLLCACTQETMEPEVNVQDARIIRSVLLTPDLWLDESGSRSIYNPENNSIQLEGTENMTVWYASAGNGLAGSSKASPSGTAAASTTSPLFYKFSHDEITGATGYDYYFVLPYLSTNEITPVGETAAEETISTRHRVSPVQMPSAGSFDPRYDYLTGYPQLNADLSTELAVDKLKRLMAPFLLTVKDANGVLGGEKLYSVTLSFASTGSCITGVFDLTHSQLYEECKISWVAGTQGNTVTALYPSGLDSDGTGNYPVWFMLNATAISADTPVTLTVASATKTVTRTVNWAQGGEIKLGHKNSLTIGIPADAIPQCSFSQLVDASISAGSVELTASDGNSYTWEMPSGCGWDGTALGFPNALRIKKGLKLVLPYAPNRFITKIRVYGHVYNNNVNVGLNTDVRIKLMCGETEVTGADGPPLLGLYSETEEPSGVCEIAVPQEYANKELSLMPSDASLFVSGVTIEYAATTYLDLYQAGGFPIGDSTIDKDSYPTYQHITAGTADPLTAIKAGGLIFIDSGVSVSAAAEVIALPADTPTVLVGNDPFGAQPAITCGEIQANGKVLALKNIYLTCSGKAITNPDVGTSTEDCSLYVEDCRCSVNRFCILDQNTTGRRIVKVLISNSVVCQTSSKKEDGADAVIACTLNNSTATAAQKNSFERVESIAFNNSVFYATRSGGLKGSLVAYGSGVVNAKGVLINDYNTINLKVVVKNCSTWNIWQDPAVFPLVHVYTAKSMYFGYNVGYYDAATVNGSTCLVGAYNGVTDGVTSEYNYLTSNAADENIGWQTEATSQYPYSDKTSTVHNGDSGMTYYPFATANTTTGYFPIDIEKATGVGASYDMKPWIATK